MNCSLPAVPSNNQTSIHCPEVTEGFGLVLLPGLNDGWDGVFPLVSIEGVDGHALQAKQCQHS